MRHCQVNRTYKWVDNCTFRACYSSTVLKTKLTTLGNDGMIADNAIGIKEPNDKYGYEIQVIYLKLVNTQSTSTC